MTSLTETDKKKRGRLDLRFISRKREVNFWNSLGDQSVTASSVNCFKSNLSKLRRHSVGPCGQLGQVFTSRGIFLSGVTFIP